MLNKQHNRPFFINESTEFSHKQIHFDKCFYAWFRDYTKCLNNILFVLLLVSPEVVSLEVLVSYESLLVVNDATLESGLIYHFFSLRLIIDANDSYIKTTFLIKHIYWQIKHSFNQLTFTHVFTAIQYN